MRQLLNKKVLLRIAVLIAILIAIAAAAWHYTQSSRQNSEHEPDNPNQPVTVIDAAERSLDGTPALALTFSTPLGSDAAPERYVNVFEMPLSANELAQQVALKNNPGQEDDPHHSIAKIPASSTKTADIDTKGGKLVAGAWVAGDNPRIIYFPHIKPLSRYVIQVKAGLPAHNGKTLAAEARHSIFTSEVTPAFYFASNGMVLPAKQNGGLPIVTVNVPEVDVQFLKVKNEQLPRFLDRVIDGAATKSQTRPDTDLDSTDHSDNNKDGQDDQDINNQSWMHSNLRGAVMGFQLEAIRNLTDSVYQGRFLTEKQPNKRSVTYLPVEDIRELREPGIYVVVMSQPGRFRDDYQTSYFYVSDIGLHTRLYEKSADVFVSSLVNGKAVSDVEISWLDAQGKVLARAASDQDGHASFAEKPQNAKVILAKKNQQLSMLALKEPALDLSEYTITGPTAKPVRLFAYAGRNLYRPGENFDLSVTARDADGHSVPAQPIQARLKRPDGRTQLSAFWQPDARFSGYYQKKISIPTDAPTGNWTLELRSDPADKIPATIFKFGVEEFLPERMKLDLSSQQTTLSPGTGYSIEVSGNYLYGAPASGNRLLGVVQFERNRNPFSTGTASSATNPLPGFEFGDANENEVKNRIELAQQTLNQAGTATVAVDLTPVAKRRSPFTVRTTLSLLETGGRPVVRSLEKVVWPAPVLLGVRPLFTGEYAKENSPAEFEVIRADSNAKLLAGSNLPARLFREDRNYYWRFEDQRGWQSGFTETDELVATDTVTVPAGGRGKLRFPVRYGRYRLELIDPATNQQLVYRFYAGWNAQTDETQGIRPDRVALKLDKLAYNDGDTVQLTITPPHNGEALITVEGDRTLWMKRTPVSAQGSTLSIPLKPEWKRHDLYISAIVLRPGNEGDKITPARALGIVHLPLQREDRKLKVSIEAPVKIKPETSVNVKIRVPNAKGQKAMVTLSAVDVGILNITKFATPDPHEFYFGRLRYGADQHDVYGRLIEKMQGQQGKLKFGGDNTPKASKSLPKKVLMVDLFNGPVALNDQGEASVSLSVPDFNGTLRLMAVVSGSDNYGSAEQEMQVAAPLVAEIATPRFLSLGDTAMIALDLTNLSGTPQQFTLNLSSSAGLTIGNRDETGSRGGTGLTINLKNQEKRTLRFPLSASSLSGTANTVSQAGFQNINLKINNREIAIERNFPLLVQAPTPLQQISRRYAIKPGDSLLLREADLAGLVPSSVAAHLVLSNKPPFDVRSAVQGLIRYPYGCAEQTTSTAYPFIFIDEGSAKKLNLLPPNLIKSYSRADRAIVLDQAIARLSTMQAPNGGYSLWGNAAEFEYWLSAYVSHFLVDAREQGFAVPDPMFNRSMEFLLRGLQEGVSALPSSQAQIKTQAASIWVENRVADNSRFNALAYGAYVLSRTNKAPLATLRQLHESRGLASNSTALAHLGIALKQMGDDPRSKIALKESISKPRNPGYWWYDYGSDLRDAALTYSLLLQHHITEEGSENLLDSIASSLKNRQYFSTQEQMALFMIGNQFSMQSGKPWTSTVTIGGKKQTLASDIAVFRELAATDLSGGITLNNTSADTLWVEFSMNGNPLKSPAPKKDLIQLSRHMFAPDGSPIGNRPLNTGETIIMRVRVSATSEIGTGLVIDRIPAGLEIENGNIVQGEQMGTILFDKQNPAEAMQDARIRHVEFRDDRFVAAVRLDSNPITLFYRLRVVTPGKFVIPPLYAEDMVRPDNYGLSPGYGTGPLPAAGSATMATSISDTLTITDSQPPATAKNNTPATTPASTQGSTAK